MSTIADMPSVQPRTREGLIIRPLEDGGRFVIKNPAEGTYFHIGQHEHFLFTHCDGRSGADVCAAFERRFQEPLSAEDFGEFVTLGLKKGLLQWPAGAVVSGAAPSPAARRARTAPSRRRQDLLNFRYPFFDPDRLFDFLEPRLQFLWTRGFLIVSALFIAVAALVALANAEQWISTFPSSLTWETALLVFCLILGATLLHEFAHGLTCKHFGGEVREVGFLMLLFMPCLYCNVSDAWLFREKWKRLAVGLAGAYCDLLLCAAATIAWRLTVQETAVNYFAWVLSSVCGARTLFNFNPLIKLDGYYLLSDWAEVPNLADRSKKRWSKTLRWLLWGGSRPAPEPDGKFLLVYGAASWLFLALISALLLLALLHVKSAGRFEFLNIGYLGVALSTVMLVLIGKNMSKGIFVREFTNMLSKRKRRTLLWLGGVVGIPGLLFAVPFNDRASGTFQVRPCTRVEVVALEAGFLRDIVLEEGSHVSAGMPIARIDVPDLEVNLSKKQAEIRESQANLRKLEAGPRPELVAEQRQRVVRGIAWRDLGRQDLERSTRAHREELLRLDRLIAQYEAESKYSQQVLDQSAGLHQQNLITAAQYLAEKTKHDVALLELEQAKAQKRARDAKGTLEAEVELARREKELADQQSDLKLLEAGGRPEEIDAERARLARLTEELKYLENMQSRVVLRSPVTGIVTTPRMKEKNGQYAPTGTVVCVVEDLSEVAAEIAITEDQEHEVSSGQLVELRARAMPFRTFQAHVERKAPSAVLQAGHTQGNVTVYCRLSEPDAEILSGMTGYARIYRGTGSLGMVLCRKAARYLRTEFWLW